MGLIGKIFEKFDLGKSEAKTLTEAVKRKGETKPTFLNPNYKPGDYHQMDLLFLPEDRSKVDRKEANFDDGNTQKKSKKTIQKGNKYLLVITDIGSGAVDARPLKSKDGDVVLKKTLEVYKSGKYLKQPKYIHIDAGTEFSLLKEHFLSKKVGVRVASTGRHSQQSVVEAMNKVIGGTILELQLHNELNSGEVERDWTYMLPNILEVINKEHVRKPLKKNPLSTVLCNKNTKTAVWGKGKTECDLIEIGSMVRYALDYPVDIKGKRQYGSFRTGDIRWSKPKKVENILMLPNQPIRYVVEGVKNNTFSKFQLKPYTATEKMNDVNKVVPIQIIEIVRKPVGSEAKPVDKLLFLIEFDDKINRRQTRPQLLEDGFTDKDIRDLIIKGKATFPLNGKKFQPFPPLYTKDNAHLFSNNT